jgi:hypothetical protein
VKELTCTATTTDSGKFKPCGPCASRKSKCGVLQDLPEIVDRDGQTVHPAKSWGHLTSRIKAKSDGEGTSAVPSTSKVTEASKSSRKGKGKEREQDPVTEDDENGGGWVTEVELEQVSMNSMNNAPNHG